MKYTINNICHYPGAVHLKQGIKKYQYSKFAAKNRVVGGSNGSYLVAEKSETIVNMADENGKNHSIDVYYSLKDITNGRRFTGRFIDDLNSKIENVEFEVKEGETIKDNLNKILKKAI